MNMKYPLYKKINPLWWFGNANDPVDGIGDDGKPNHATFYLANPLWIRQLMWGLRNPLHNFFFFVIGLEDRPDVVNCGSMWPKEGQKWNIILPFIARRGTKKEWYIGWRNGKTFGAAFRNSKSKPM